MTWESNSQQHNLQGEHQYGSCTGEPQQLHYTYEQEHNEQQTGFYQPGQNFQHVVYTQPQPFATGQSLNLGSIAAILSYAGGWFTGLLFFLFAGQNRYVRFHALQSLIFFAAINVLDIALFNLGMFGRFHLHYITAIAFFSFFLLNIMAFFGWLIAMIQAARGRYYKMPFVGDFVERCLSRGVILK
jgi:uncharacterized membrane protein